ncbi:MAG: hypothetical protein JWQ62_1686 [Lacunisphaera sp.]|nr:hypothetical protein [Lacunisphaera sp.]
MFILAGAGGLRAENWQSLLARPPFGEAAAPVPGSRAEWEFRGVVEEEGVDLVNLYNPATKTSRWLPVHGGIPGLEVLAYDATSAQLQVSLAGRSLTLSLKQAHVSLLADVKAVQPVDPAQVLADDAAGSDFRRNLPPDTRKVLEEVRRRRGMRVPFLSGEPVEPGRDAEPAPRPETP